MLDNNYMLIHDNEFLTNRKKKLTFFLNFLLDQRIIILKNEDRQVRKSYINAEIEVNNIMAEELTKKFFETEFDENYFKSCVNGLDYYPITSQYLKGMFSSLKSFIFGE